MIIWTRPQKLDLFGVAGYNDYPPICVEWMVSASEGFNSSSIVKSGKAYTSIDIDFTVKVEVDGLQPYKQYNYMFQSCTSAELGASDIGSFKTLPEADVIPDNIRIAVFSCSNLPYGFFNAYGNAANHSETLDYVSHLGDYIYEYADGA